MKIFKVLGYELKFSDGYEKYNKYKNLFSNEANENIKKFQTFYSKEIKKYDDLFDAKYTAQKLIGDTLQKAVKILVSEGIMSLDENKFREKYNKYIDFDEYYYSAKGENEIDETRETQEYKLKARQAQRGRWQGGGFGIEGAIKGAATAGALNMGSDMIHSISDSNRKLNNENSIRRLEQQIFNDPNTYEKLRNGVYNCTFKIFFGVINELSIRGKIESINMETEETTAIFNNVINYVEKNSEEYYERILKCITINPYNFKFYEELLKKNYRNNQLVELATYFGFGEKVHKIIDPIIKKEDKDKKCLQIYFTEDELKNSKKEFDINKEIQTLQNTYAEPTLEDVKSKGGILGGYYIEGKGGYSVNHKRGFFWTKKSAELGELKSQVGLGYCYLLGAGTEKNIEKGVKWLNKSIESGNDTARILLGKEYAEGVNINKDYNRAFELFKSATNCNGEVEYRASYYLGNLYMVGNGVEKDIELAKKYFKIANKSKEKEGVLSKERLKQLDEGIANLNLSDKEVLNNFNDKQEKKFRRNRIITYIILCGVIVYLINGFVHIIILKYGLMIFFIAVFGSLINDEFKNKVNKE